MRIAIIAPGEMGAALGARLASRGATVTTSLAGRSGASADRAAAAGLTAVDDDAALVQGADLVLSVLPPSEAFALARRLAPALAGRGGRTAYADCNAVAPATVRQISAVIEQTGAPFIDIGIIGLPPRGEGPGPKLYASGAGLDRVRPLAELGLDLRPLEGPAGEASALKMSYAAITKGILALGAAVRAAELAPATAAALRAESVASQPDITAWLDRLLPGIYPKAYRWVGEMEEIARFLEPQAGADIYRGIARLYQQVADDHAAAGTKAAE